MDENAFQRACGEFVSREVYCCVSTMAEYILKKSWEDRDAPFSNDDIENPMQSANIWWNKEDIEICSMEELEEWKEQIEAELEKTKETEIDIRDGRLAKEEITLEEYDEIIEEIDETFDSKMSLLDDAYENAESDLNEYKEIYEYWIVSPYLISKLQDRNEAVIPSEQIWCRCTSGQAIAIDGVIREIVKEQLVKRREWDEEAKQILL